MTRNAILITLAAAAALAGCDIKGQTIGGDDTNKVENTSIALPPSITGSKSYRCKDNKLIYIDWMSDGTARVKKTREEIGTTVTPGNELMGDSAAKTVNYYVQACNS